MKYVLRAAVAVLVAALAAFLIGGSAYAHPGSADDNHHPSGKDRSVEAGGSGTQGKSTSEPDDDGRGPERDYNQGAGADEDGLQDKPGKGGGAHTDDQDGNNGCGNDDDFEDDNEGWCGQKPKKTKPAPETPGEVGGEDTEKTCPAGQEMGDNGKCECPAGHEMDDDSDKCVEVKGDDEEKVTEPTCPTGETMVDGECVKATNTVTPQNGAVAGAGTDVKGEVLGRLPVTGAEAAGTDARVLGVQIERTPEAAPAVLGTQFGRTGAAALARTGVGIVSLVALGLGLVTLGAIVTRRRSNA